MIPKSRLLALFVLALLAASHLTGCGKTPSARFYTLTALAETEGRTAAAPVRTPRQVVGIGPIALPKYLEHPAIATRGGATVLNRSELDRWGGSLADETSRVLVENLSILLPDARYLPLPWLEATRSDYRVQINITRFDGPAEGPVHLNAGWLLFNEAGNRLLAANEATIAEPLQGTGYAATAEAMSRALAELSRRIAGAIAAAAQSPPPEKGIEQP